MYVLIHMYIDVYVSRDVGMYMHVFISTYSYRTTCEYACTYMHK